MVDELRVREKKFVCNSLHILLIVGDFPPEEKKGKFSSRRHTYGRDEETT